MLSPEALERGERAVADFLAYLERLVAERRANPGDPERDVLTRLNSASGYVDRIGGLTRMTDQYSGWQRSYADSAGQFARTLGLQQGQQADNAALLARLQQSSQSAEGQMQAIQAGNQLAAASMGQLMQVQATISASTQYAMQRDLVAADRSALNDAAMQRFLGGPTPPLTGYQTW